MVARPASSFVMAAPRAGSSGDRPRPRGESCQRSISSERTRSSCSFWHVRGRRASLLSIGRRHLLRVPAHSSPRLVQKAQSAVEPPAPDRIGTGRSSLCGTAVSCSVASLLRRR
ncbi:hypothetical protein NDU88_005387 [Pleurodeles waltl]|uniref:Uncharacterized protein n=1 Tax=Pleurodeles waltl TaxID=8319 RepID=A0AAV7N131_PLEWA|nr:hypothetical protein NDU88_005387 [Pleurodeles waltl]